MPEVVQTGVSVAIDFLSGFGKGMVQADINRREQEKHEVQKQRWQQEMTAFAAQDELRKMQMENSRLEVDIRKTQFADIQATKEQTKGFTAFMFDSIGKAKGNPADIQAGLFEAYLGGAAQFPQADMSIADKLVDAYSKIHTASTPKAWKFKDVKNYETGKKQTAIVGEYGEVINYMPGSMENLDIVNETITKGIDMQQEEFNTHLQAIMTGKDMVLGSDGKSLDIQSLMARLEGLDNRSKSEVTMDWMFSIRDRIWHDIHATSGTLDARLDKMLTPYVHDKKHREVFTKPYGKASPTEGAREIIDKFPIEDQHAVIASMLSDYEKLSPATDMPAIEMEMARLQNKVSMEMRATGTVLVQQESEQLSMAEQVAKSNRQKEEELLKKFVGYEAPEKGFRQSTRDWWDDFLGQERERVLFGEGERESEAYETLRSMQQSGVK